MLAKHILYESQHTMPFVPLTRICVLAMCGLIMQPEQTLAETLQDALRSTYAHNSQLNAERANLRATDETVPQALSNARPSIALSADAAIQRQNSGPDTVTASRDGTSYPAGYSVSLNQPIFRGLQTHSAVNAAEANVRAGRATLQATEQQVLLDAVTAFMNVVRDTAIVRLRKKNVTVLSQDLKGTQERLNVGEATRTDVAQSRARSARAASDLDQARANLNASLASFKHVIGHSPSRLHEPQAPFHLLPKTLSEALQRAERDSPNVVAALYNEQAAYYKTNEISGELLPTFSVDASYANRYAGGGDTITTQTETGVVTGTLSVPLYQRGAVSSRIRQAKHLHMRTIQLVEDARSEAREHAAAAWAQLSASRTKLNSTQAQVEASKVALSGVREEEQVGQRTLLDILDAERELLDAEVALVSNLRDLVVNAYAVLSAVGRLTAKDLKLTSRAYEAKAHSDDVRHKWYGISITHANGQREYLQTKTTQPKE